MSGKINFPQDGFEEFEKILGLRTNTPRDIVLLSLDLEVKKYIPKNNIQNEITEIGISMFDTRCLTKRETIHLKTRHFIIGGQRRFYHVSSKFCFGISEHLVGQEHVNDAILDLLHIPDDKKPGAYRDVILVGHGLRTDLLVLRRRGVMFENIRSIVGLLDTTYIARDLLGMNFRLEGLLKFLLCPVENFHLAGNDANYALRALLMLAYHDLRSGYSSPEALRTLTSLRSLGLEPLPDITERNARLRILKPRCEYFDIDGIDEEGIFGILEQGRCPR
ncbi:hypothetical protein ONS95_013157 [Cadophora gregata]|uniref:uncharacterized protein n=1 Tax=Cadophora gregata TaxID=51156 RepID=UPI0026DC9781|nr:uncharacterized protein ONS95_013157 [Cadophora gregata]KAK0100028.1 hypothetical protein ONS96_007967 [Cadophora gregata f. sp. sojae]KAK0116125.1 hypothetical protein ONS95_013157 [Cadophora gregata]